jgi:Cysteine-rich secretory protein family
LDQHDCHNTPEMMYSGQNLDKIITFGGGSQFKTIPEIIESSVKTWYDENQYASMNEINNCCGVTTGPKQIGHFLELVLDKNNEVGCALAQYTSSQGKKSVIACNYGFTIITGRTVYESGTPGSGCQSGTNPDYPNLCSASEEVDLNKVF